MEFNFGKKLKELRNTKNVTQETLASHLQISPQSVSKWERGDGYPDIMLLPRIAGYFGVTVDELLGTSEEILNEKFDAWKNESDALLHSGDTKKLLSIWEPAYRQYPNHLGVINMYMFALYHNLSKDDADFSEKAEKTIELGKEILERSTNSNQRNNAIQLIVFTYRILGNAEEAKKYVDMTSSLYTCREMLLPHVLKGDELIEHCQELVISMTDIIANKIDMNLEDRHSVETRIEIMKYVIGLFEGLFPDGDFGYCNHEMYDYTGKLSRLYATVGDRDRCIEELQKSAYYAAAFDDFYNGTATVKHTSPLVDKTVSDPKRRAIFTNHNFCYHALRWTENSVYDPYRDDSEFIRIKAELETRAE